MCCVLFMASNVNAQSLSIRKQQFQISGSVGVADVVMKGLPGAVITNANGGYTATVDYNWKGSITPTLAGYEFTPRSRPVGPVKASMGNIDFSGKIQTFEISGSVGLPNVTIHGLGTSVVAGATGNFKLEVPYGTTLTLTPELEGYSFSPPTIDYPQVNRNYPAQRFSPEKKRYTISGLASCQGMLLSNVTLKIKGIPTAEVKTGTDGRYAVTVTHGASVEIMPEREGFTFFPENRKYMDVTADEVTNYEGTQLRYTITGNAGAPDVLLRYSGGSTLSDQSGNYSITLDHGTNVSIKPAKEGFQFNPPEITHPKLTRSLVNQSFRAEEIFITIAGNTGTGNVLLDGLIDVSGEAVSSDANGQYRAKVKYNSTLAVMPIKPGYTFSPASKQYPNVTQDQMGEVYKADAITFEISGSVGLRDVVMTGPQGRFKSLPTGRYTVTVPFGWSGVIKPELPGYTFDPPSKTYQDIRENLYSNEDYYPTKKTYQITGLVTSPAGPVAEANIRLGGLGGLMTTTNDQGRFSLEVEHGEAGRLSVDKEGYAFSSATLDIPPVVQNRDVSFAGTVRKMTIKGRLLDGNLPVSEVKLTADNGGGVAVSDAQGRWSIEVPFGWIGEISMQKQGMLIDTVFPFDIPVTEDVDLAKPASSVPDAQPGGRETPPTRVVDPPRIDRTVDPTPPTGVDPGTSDIMPSNDLFDKFDEPNETSPEPTVSPDVQALRQEIDRLRAEFARQNATEIDGTGQLIDRGPMVSSQAYAGDELSTVLSMMGEEVGIPIITDMDVIHNTYVSHGAVPLEVALDMLVAGTDYSWIKTKDYYLVSNMQPTKPAFITGSVTQKIKMGHITAADAVKMLSDSMAKFVKAEPGGSYVIVTAGPRITERIVQDLKSFDVPAKQVLLQSKVVVMEEGDLLNMGIEWSWPKVSAGLFSAHYKGETDQTTYDTGGKGIWGVRMGYSLGSTFTDALTMGLNLLQENDQAQMIATPSTMAADGKLATMAVLTEEYFMLTPTGAGGAVFSQSELQQIDSGVKLDITPHIADNNDIVLDIAVELSDSIPSGRASGLPVVTRRTATNTVRVKNGGSAVIAGLNENRKTTKKKRTPGLSSIPLLGKLFSNDYNDTASRDVAIFVTANIIKDRRPVAPMPVENPVAQPPVGNMNSFPPASYDPAIETARPRTPYQASPTQYGNTPSANPPGSYDSFQAELRRTIAAERARNNAAFNN